MKPRTSGVGSSPSRNSAQTEQPEAQHQPDVEQRILHRMHADQADSPTISGTNRRNGMRQERRPDARERQVEDHQNDVCRRSGWPSGLRRCRGLRDEPGTGAGLAWIMSPRRPSTAIHRASGQAQRQTAAPARFGGGVVWRPRGGDARHRARAQRPVAPAQKGRFPQAPRGQCAKSAACPPVSPPGNRADRRAAQRGRPARAEVGARGPGPAHAPDAFGGRPEVSSARMISARPRMPHDQRHEADPVAATRGIPKVKRGCPPAKSGADQAHPRSDQDQPPAPEVPGAGEITAAANSPSAISPTRPAGAMAVVRAEQGHRHASRSPPPSPAPRRARPALRPPARGPARPINAILCPSIAVTTPEHSPGRFSKMELVEPPYCAP